MPFTQLFVLVKTRVSIANINLSRTKTVPKSGGERNMVGVLPSFLFTIRLHQNPSGSFVED